MCVTALGLACGRPPPGLASHFSSLPLPPPMPPSPPATGTASASVCELYLIGRLKRQSRMPSVLAGLRRRPRRRRNRAAAHAPNNPSINTTTYTPDAPALARPRPPAPAAEEGATMQIPRRCPTHPSRATTRPDCLSYCFCGMGVEM